MDWETSKTVNTGVRSIPRETKSNLGEKAWQMNLTRAASVARNAPRKMGEGSPPPSPNERQVFSRAPLDLGLAQSPRIRVTTAPCHGIGAYSADGWGRDGAGLSVEHGKGPCVRPEEPLGEQHEWLCAASVGIWNGYSCETVGLIGLGDGVGQTNCSCSMCLEVKPNTPGGMARSLFNSGTFGDHGEPEYEGALL